MVNTRIKYYCLLMLFCINYVAGQTSMPYKLSRTNNHQTCDEKIKVLDAKPNNCNWPNNTILYPVLIEDFNYKEDLPNNFGFNMGYTNDDDYPLNGSYNIWSGPDLEAYDNNLTVNNGKCYLEVKKEARTNKIPYLDSPPKDYPFTCADLRTLFKLNTGVFYCQMKVPENNLLWPAFWLREKKAEIDIFEFYDGDVSNGICDVYHSLRMTTINHIGSTKCERRRKFPVASDYFDYFHEYQLIWSNYKYHFYHDGGLVVYGNRYYDGPFQYNNSCQTGGGPPLIPQNSYSCNDMINMQGCNVTNPINNNCLVFNKVHQDKSFITDYTPMELYISFSIFNQKNRNQLVNSWNNYNQENKQIELDRLVIWQPISCINNLNVCSKNSFKTLSNGTAFLSGSKISIGGCTVGNFITDPPVGLSSHNENYQFLAIDEIKFNEGVEIAEGTYIRAQIIQCIGSSELQRNASGVNLPSFAEVSDEEIAEIERKQLDSLLKSNPELMSEYLEYIKLNGLPEKRAEVDNGAIVLYPNPAIEQIHIDMAEEDFFDLTYLEIIDALGRPTRIEKSNLVDIKQLSPGLYQLKFVFTHGFIVVKSFIKANN